MTITVLIGPTHLPPSGDQEECSRGCTRAALTMDRCLKGNRIDASCLNNQSHKRQRLISKGDDASCLNNRPHKRLSSWVGGYRLCYVTPQAILE